MKIAAMTFRLHAPWVHSLKEKRMIVKSLVAKLQNKFHVSAAEIDEQDTHQIIMNAVKRIERLYLDMLRSADPEYSIKIAKQLIALQSEDGAWGVIKVRRGDSDIINAYVCMPTYYATAALMRCKVQNVTLPEEMEESLHRGLKFAQERELNGHGFDATADKLKALEIYKKAGLYDWMVLNKDAESEFCAMIRRVIEGFRNGIITGHTLSDWSRDFRKEFEQEVAEYDEHMCQYVWYAAYGSNLCLGRFMEYISACTDRSEPEESRPYEIPFELYFAYRSRRWNGSGVAFIDTGKSGRTMGRIYKIRREQFLEIQRMEGAPYRNKFMLGKVENIPVYSFTSPQQRTDINHPNKEYLDVMLKGLAETYSGKAESALMAYLLLSHGAIQDDDKEILSFLRNASHGQSIFQIFDCGLPVTRVKKSVKALSHMGLIKQDSRSIAAGHSENSPDAVFYTVKNKREVIDIVLLALR